MNVLLKSDITLLNDDYDILNQLWDHINRIIELKKVIIQSMPMQAVINFIKILAFIDTNYLNKGPVYIVLCFNFSPVLYEGNKNSAPAKIGSIPT